MRAGITFYSWHLILLTLLALMLSNSASAISRILISVPADFATIGAALEHASDHAITFASVHTVATLPAAAPYAASKGGVDMLTRSMAIEFAPFGIRVNALSPGLTDTQIWNDIQDAAEDAGLARQHWMDNIPLGRVQTPREVGNVVLFLASDQSSYMTGANIFSDGGMTIQLTSRERFASRSLEGVAPQGGTPD